MHQYPVMFSLPGAGMIAVLGKRYPEPLTDDFIQQWLYDLYCDHLVTPDYLLVSIEEARQELRRIVYSDLYMYHWSRQVTEETPGGRIDRYPNKTTGRPLTIVVFPGLPEKTLMVASLLTMKEEQVQTSGLTRVTTRTYERSSKQEGDIRDDNTPPSPPSPLPDAFPLDS